MSEAQERHRREQVVIIHGLRHAPIRVLVERSELAPAQVRRILRGLPRRRSA